MFGIITLSAGSDALLWLRLLHATRGHFESEKDEEIRYHDHVRTSVPNSSALGPKIAPRGAQIQSVCRAQMFVCVSPIMSSSGQRVLHDVHEPFLLPHQIF